MKLQGIKANFLGDSITEGHGASSQEYTYWNILKRNFGLGEVRGYGIGGTRIARKHVPTPEPYGWFDMDFCGRYDEMDNDADLVVVMGGTNDYGHGDAPLGEMSDRDPMTFYGALHYLMNGLINKYPKAMIVFMTPPHREEEENRGLKLVDFVNAVKEVAAYYAIPVLDLYATSGIQPKVPILKELYMPDGLHPNDAGYEKIADRLGNFLLSL